MSLDRVISHFGGRNKSELINLGMSSLDMRPRTLVARYARFRDESTRTFWAVKMGRMVGLTGVKALVSERPRIVTSDTPGKKGSNTTFHLFHFPFRCPSVPLRPSSLSRRRQYGEYLSVRSDTPSLRPKREPVDYCETVKISRNVTLTVPMYFSITR